MHEGPQLHIVMGMEEATLIGTAVGMLIAHIDNDIHNADTGTDTDMLMSMLSTKLTASNIFMSLWESLGMPREEVSAFLAKMEETNE